TSVATVADASRAMQGALYKDVEATLAAVEKLASSKSLAEAARVHVEFLNQRGQVGLERFKSATDYLANALQSASKAVQDNIAKMSERAGKAA
ncbi:MAG: phasin family protein, partial [Roseiarcus sp.]